MIARIAAILLVLAASTALTVFGAEAVLRTLPGSTAFYVLPPSVVRVFTPSAEIMPGVDGAKHYSTNSSGMRGDELGERGTEHRILAVGGSTTECLYLDDSEAWPALVQRALGRTPDGRRVWVGNVGRSGMNARDHVIQVKHLLRQHEVDTMLLLVGINDLTVALARTDDAVHKEPVTTPAAEAQQIRRAFAIPPGRLHEQSTEFMAAQDAPWHKKTAVYQVLKRARSRIEAVLTSRGFRQDEAGTNYQRVRAHRKQAPRLIDELPELRPSIAEFRRNLETIADLARERGVRLVMLTQPTLWRHDLSPREQDLLWFGGVGNFVEQPGKPYHTVPVLMEAMGIFNRTVLGVCRDRGIECVDLAARLSGDTRIFYDDVHFTEDGARLVADLVSDALRRTPPFSR